MVKLTEALARILPMELVEYCLFLDIRSGKSVNLYRDIAGNHWMAETRFSLFRVLACRLALEGREEK